MSDILTCKIRWIDGQGNPTPDENPAIGFARCLGYEVPEDPSFKPEPSEWYPICKDHRFVMLNSCLDVERSGRWEFRKLA